MRPILLVCLSLAGASLAEAATVQKIKLEKKIVIIDEGKNTGFSKKKKVCIYDENKNKIACGRIRSAKAKMSSILIKKDEDLAKVKEGMTADVENIDNKDVKITIDENEEKPVVQEYKAPSYIGLFGEFPIRDPVTYQNLIYEDPLNKDVETMWSAESPVKAVGLGGEFGFGIKSLTLAVGARSRTFSPKRIASDYGDPDANGVFKEYVESIGKGKSTGAWLDLSYARWDWGVASLNLGNGIDIDTSSVDFTLDHKADGTDVATNLYKAKSTLKAISLRTKLLLDFKFGPVGFKMGSVLYIPLSQAEKITVEQSDAATNSFLKTKTAQEDLKTKLGHKSQVGLDLLLMGYFAY
ncbi:MAG: hypothetical protein H7249_11210 [Chitinophagaceae bacterium]|nr:hypothetical protein [Oligoflexus sp.]